MSGSKKFLHDRIVLLLISINSFLVLFGGLSIILRLGTSTHAQGLIGEYRSNLGLSAFRPGNTYTFVGFVVFLLFVLIYHIVLGRKVYYIRRYFALTVLASGTLLLVLAAIVGNSLLGL